MDRIQQALKYAIVKPMPRVPEKVTPPKQNHSTSNNNRKRKRVDSEDEEDLSS